MQTEPSEAEPLKRQRRWFQFSLRTLLIGVTGSISEESLAISSNRVRSGRQRQL
jgi:hypothetical protein